MFRAELDLLRQENSGHANGGGLRLDLEEADRAIDAARSIPPPKDDDVEEPAERAYWVAWDAATSRLYDAVGSAKQPLSALCFSGGGIRSASFNLGVMQALAKRGLLSTFDYLSSVSGGGYVAGWLQAWIARWGAARNARRYVARLGRVPRVDGAIPGVPPSSPHAPEPRAVEHLREFSNFLTPRLGLFSGDTWALVAIVARNIVLNWLVFLPIFAGAMGLPVLAMYRFDVRGSASPLAIEGALALACAAAAVSFHLQRQSASARAGPDGAQRPGSRLRSALAVASAASFGLAAVLLAWAAPPVLDAQLFPWNEVHLKPSDPDLLLVVAAWTLLVPLAGWMLAWIADGALQAASKLTKEPVERRGWAAFRPALEMLAVIVSGALAGGALLLAANGWSSLLRSWAWLQWHHAASFAAAAPLALVLSLLFARSLFIAFKGHLEDVPADSVSATTLDEAGREWWGRQSGLMLGGACAWMLFFVIAGTGEWLLGVDGASLAATAAWVGVGGGAALLGMSDKVPFGRELKRRASTLLKENAVVLAAAAGLVALLAALAAGNISAGGAACRALPWLTDCPVADPAPGAAHDRVSLDLMIAEVAVSVALIAMGVLLGFVVDANRCSLQGLYRNRLVRAFLGASRGSQRHADPFTGFDPRDDVPLASLAGSSGGPRPLSIFNATLNLVAGRRLAWQERKGESFSMTPLHCGNFHDGYRPTSAYAGDRGISLGTAMAVSGAAANPNMGYVSSPLVTFVMALFNARLGSWLPNPGSRGERVQGRSGPRNAALALLRELLGRTDGDGSYVNLSDGGHFDNLGLYEAVLRRCRLIVVSDAGADPKASFADLGKTLRKIRIDFGIPIDFEQGLHIRARGRRGDAYALGRIHYEEVDGGGAAPGVLLYLKPTVAVKGRAIPADVRAYARRSRTFPHESTADQWFSESQFESYRRLGEFLAVAAVEDVLRVAPPPRRFHASVTAELFQRADLLLAGAPAVHGRGGDASAWATAAARQGDAAPEEGAHVERGGHA
ncbi:MAG TPA: hypothetical protein VLT61_07410 [Anaeromyxobacteraceae bacterium]|nr:hypothetical protein [Anaeromyxobacteraceae bacterium]